MSEQTDTTPDRTPSTGSSTVVRLTADEVVADIRTHLATLRTRTGTDDLATIVADGLRFELYGDAADHFSELSSIAWLAGLPSLPCCVHDDPDRVAAWVAGVEEIARTGTLPD